MAGHEWVLGRNCSITPRQLLAVYAALCSVSLAVAIVFAARGAWYVLPFAGLEMSALGFAFLLYARHALDRERILLDGQDLLVELVEVERVRQFRLDSRRLRIDPPLARGALVGLEANGIRVEVGRFLTEWKRRELASELRQALDFGERTEF